MTGIVQCARGSSRRKVTLVINGAGGKIAITEGSPCKVPLATRRANVQEQQKTIKTKKQMCSSHYETLLRHLYTLPTDRKAILKFVTSMVQQEVNEHYYVSVLKFNMHVYPLNFIPR
jgi:hypothetical protein